MSDNDNSDDGLPPAVVTTLSDVKPELVEWLWPGYLPRGKLVMLDGDPSVGKSTLSMSFAATVTVGGLWPDGSRCEHPGDVVLLSAEDGLADTVLPRLLAGEGDPKRVHCIEGKKIITDTGEHELMLTLSDIALLRREVLRKQARLVIVDVLMAFMPAGSDSHNDQSVRGILAPLSKFADETGCTILMLRHLNKGTAKALYRGGGSIAIVGAARVGLLAAADPDDQTGERRALASMKNNLAPTPPTLTYTLVDASTADYSVARVAWSGISDHTAHDLLNAEPRRESDDDLDTRDYTADLKESWLYKFLADARKAEVKVRPKDAVAYASDKGIGRSSVFNHFNTLANAGMAESIDGTEFPRVTHWQLVDRTTGRHSETGWTTGTTRPDLRKEGWTTGENGDTQLDYSETDTDQAKQDEKPPVVPVVHPDPGEGRALCPDCRSPLGKTGRCVPCIVSKASQQQSTTTEGTAA